MEQRLIKLRDVLAHGLRELAIRVAQVDLSVDVPTEDEVRAFVSTVADAAQKAAASGCVVPEHVAVFADPRMIAAALELSKQSVRVQYAEGQTVLLAPPPPGYTLGSIAHEIDKAAQEARPTDVAPAPMCPVGGCGAAHHSLHEHDASEAARASWEASKRSTETQRRVLGNGHVQPCMCVECVSERTQTPAVALP